MKEDEESEVQWRVVLDAAQTVIAAYRTLVKATEAFAEIIRYKENFVFNQVFPQRASDRKTIARFEKWLNAEQAGILDHWRECRQSIEKESAREALLKRLNLTDDERELLGIKAPGEQKQETDD